MQTSAGARTIEFCFRFKNFPNFSPIRELSTHKVCKNNYNRCPHKITCVIDSFWVDSDGLRLNLSLSSRHWLTEFEQTIQFKIVKLCYCYCCCYRWFCDNWDYVVSLAMMCNMVKKTSSLQKLLLFLVNITNQIRHQARPLGTPAKIPQTQLHDHQIQ